MSATGGAPIDSGALDLPPFSLDVETLELGAGVKAVGLELLGTESRACRALGVPSLAALAERMSQLARPGGGQSWLERVR